tara:strand:- start:32819 stop:34531 length:1713 start_codon:yes stop_codon:yes gene_type:complete
MQLQTIDFFVIATYLIFSLLVGFYFTKKASSSLEDFFLSHRSQPWWLIGVSMAATNFAIDTPLATSKFIAQNGLAGAWFYWSSGISAVAATFLFSKLWRRAEVMTDNELIELRYSGKPASFLRFFKGVYFGIFINCFVLGWVFNALTKVASIVTPWDSQIILLFFGGIALIYTISSGFYGVILTDLIQYIFALSGSFILAYLSIKEVGGLSALTTKISALYPSRGFLDVFPSVNSEDALIPPLAMFTLLFVKWWAHKYSDGGGKHIQRMSAAKNEKHATFGTFFYAFMANMVTLWPWIIVAICGVILFPDNPDPETNYPKMMLKVLPPGLLGLCVMGLIGAFMSTVDTHLNLGANYFVNDIYKRFFVKEKSQKHYILISRLSIIGIMLIAILLSLQIKSVASAWLFILTFASGAGLVWILRWFWWRINAYSEISAMLTSAIVASYLKIQFPNLPFSESILIVVGISTPVFLIVTFLTRPTHLEKRISFFNRVAPLSFGWKKGVPQFNFEKNKIKSHDIQNFLLGIFLLFLGNISVAYLLFDNFKLGLLGFIIFVILMIKLVRNIYKEEVI